MTQTWTNVRSKSFNNTFHIAFGNNISFHKKIVNNLWTKRKRIVEGTDDFIEYQFLDYLCFKNTSPVINATMVELQS